MMASLGTLPVSLLTILLLVVPGLLGIEFYYLLSKKNASLTRIQWVVYSTFVSIISLLTLYFASPLYYEFIDGLATDTATNLNIVSEEQILALTLPVLLTLYLLHVVISSGGSALIGLGVDKILHRGRSLDRRQPWHYAFNEVPSHGEEIEVVMNDETVIQGEFNETAWDENRRELFLDNPYEVVYSQDGGERITQHDLGRSILLREEAISRVIFTIEDPDQERTQAISEEKENGPIDQTEGYESPKKLEGILEEILGGIPIQSELDDFTAEEKDVDTETQQEIRDIAGSIAEDEDEE